MRGAGGAMLPTFAICGLARVYQTEHESLAINPYLWVARVCKPKSSTNSSQRIPSPFMGEG